MSIDTEPRYNPAASCGELLEVMASRYAPLSRSGVDLAGARREIERMKAKGLITVAPPIKSYQAEQKRKTIAARSRVFRHRLSEHEAKERTRQIHALKVSGKTRTQIAGMLESTVATVNYYLRRRKTP